MGFELYTWGPAFALPSIDAQCLATITYFSLILPKDQWNLVASCDPGSNPTKRLPALRDGANWIAGFNNIIDYLNSKSDEWILGPSSKDSSSKADVTAFSSLIESHGQMLLDLSLYVSSENYRSTTLPAYSSLLPWPEKWFVPSRLRAIAKSRTAHLNLSSLDGDETERTETSHKSVFEFVPDIFRRSPQSVSKLVSMPQHASRFRLEALAAAWLEPLQDLLADKPYLLWGQEPSSLDCLAFAYFALAIVPVVPQPWLKELVTARYSKLGAYVDNFAQLLAEGPIRANHAMRSLWPTDTASSLRSSLKEEERHEGILPWGKPQPRGFRSALRAFFKYTVNSLPIISGHQTGVIIAQDEMGKTVHASKASKELGSQWSTLPTFLTIGTTMTVIGGYLFFSGLTGFLDNDPIVRKRRFPNLGEADSSSTKTNFAVNAFELSDKSSDNRAPLAELDVSVEKTRNS